MSSKSQRCTQLTSQVQLQTLTAIVKLFLKKPDESQAVVQRVLQAATKDCDSPDVRDRAYIYWRLLSSDPAAAKVCPDYKTQLIFRPSFYLSDHPSVYRRRQ